MLLAIGICVAAIVAGIGLAASVLIGKALLDGIEDVYKEKGDGKEQNHGR